MQSPVRLEFLTTRQRVVTAVACELHRGPKAASSKRSAVMCRSSPPPKCGIPSLASWSADIYPIILKETTQLVLTSNRPLQIEYVIAENSRVPQRAQPDSTSTHLRKPP
ncbi:unnamed protein product [Angiostrongylus costaricensis]|uniref:Uncharacterized protein n=1 Tax=Angiostrongylus costaricensis TaxID=334426 RepID=A0A0R3PN88_ANGCS|nr:unnamed protein product [Angiostrongylus costaricensis]